MLKSLLYNVFSILGLKKTINSEVIRALNLFFGLIPNNSANFTPYSLFPGSNKACSIQVINFGKGAKSC